MARLKDFHEYLESRRDVMLKIGQRLSAVQQKFEAFFGQVCQVRDSELNQLTRHIVADRSKLDPELNKQLDEAEKQVDKAGDKQLSKLRKQLKSRQAEAEQVRQQSIEAERRVHSENSELDQREEALKQKAATLLGQIDAHNRRIRDLGSGWGFFANFFKMRKLAARDRQLREAHDDMQERIEALRARWAVVDQDHVAEEMKLQEKWVAMRAEIAALETKLSHLQETMPRIRLRSTVEQVLFARGPELRAPRASDPPCPRCKVPNPSSNHFCHICAKRLQDDRPDLEGSLAEIAELNLHHQRFGEGMKACQEIIGLVGGLKSGIEAFMKSVSEVMVTERVHPVPAMKIDVPSACIKYGKHFDRFAEAVEDAAKLSLHPTRFGENIGKWVDDFFTEENIKRYFETMGEELSKQADAQW